MQTALAVRDTWLIVCELLVFVVIYFVTLLAVLGNFDSRLLLPFLGWVVLYIAALRYFVPRLGRVAQAQADARSLMTGRITDAYTNIATVKLFSHARREAVLRARGDAGIPGHRAHADAAGHRLRDRQPHAVSMVLIAATRGRHAVAVDAGPGRRRRGRRRHRDGAAPERHLALGDVGDGDAVRAHRHRAGRHQHDRRGRRRSSTRPDAKPLAVHARRHPLRERELRLRRQARRDRRARRCTSARARRSAWSAARARASRRSSTCCCASTTSRAGRILIDGQDIAQVTQDSLRAQIGMVTQDTSLLHRSVRDNIVYGRPDATEADMLAAAKRAEADEFIAALDRSEGTQRLRRARRRARRQALRRPAPAHRDRARDAEGRADPAAGRGDQRARLRGRGRDPGAASTG